MDQIQIAQQQFGELIKSELERIERMKLDTEIKDFSKLDTITVGILPGDGVGPILMKQALRVLEDLMAPEIASGRLVIRQIEGMTIERRADLMQSLPDDVFQACKECDVLVKGPMVTPREGDPWPNLVSANSLLRRGLDLFAAVVNEPRLRELPMILETPNELAGYAQEVALLRGLAGEDA